MHSGREARRKREGECEGGAVTLFPNPPPFPSIEEGAKAEGEKKDGEGR